MAKKDAEELEEPTLEDLDEDELDDVEASKARSFRANTHIIASAFSRAVRSSGTGTPADAGISGEWRGNGHTHQPSHHPEGQVQRTFSGHAGHRLSYIY